MEQITVNLPSVDRMYISSISDDNDIINFYQSQINMSENNLNSGFDLVVTEDVIFPSENPSGFLPLGVKCAPGFNTGYYLYPRSSICKTPVRMSNSIGIIDMNYRGEIKAPVDINFNLINEDFYVVKKGTKLFQLCHPTLKPIKYIEVSEDELGNTSRGENGFGSSGQSIYT